MKPLIEVRNLDKEYIQGGQTLKVIGGVSLVINAGESVSISGKSGSGKTTLLNMLGVIESPTRGEVFFKGKKCLFSGGDIGMRRRMGFVFQSHNLLSGFTAFENVTLPCLICGISKSQSRARAENLLCSVGLEDKFSSFPDELSEGQQQRVSIARALVMEPDIVLADEPTGNLDPNTSNLVADVMFSARDKFNTALVVATHSRALSERFDRSLFISDGRIVDA